MPLEFHVHFTAEQKKNSTILTDCFYKQPFRVANITENKNGEILQLMLTSSSPGILSDDHYNISINIAEKAIVHLTTQGYQRLFKMTGNASQCMNVHIDNNGSFVYLPHPIVPHNLSDFTATNTIYLKGNHNLIWSEIITCGRKLSGEAFSFTRLKNITTIYLNKKLILKENVLLEPLKKNVQATGQLEGYTHQSTLLFLNDSVDIKKTLEECNQITSAINGITVGVSLLPVNGLIVRMLGYKGEQLFDINNKLALRISEILQLKKQPGYML